MLVQKSDPQYPCSYTLLKNEKFQDQKNSKAKKNYPLATNSNHENRDCSDQALPGFFKKNPCLNRGGQQGKFSNTLTTGNNAIVIKKNKKQDNKDSN